MAIFRFFIRSLNCFELAFASTSSTLVKPSLVALRTSAIALDRSPGRLQLFSASPDIAAEFNDAQQVIAGLNHLLRIGDVRIF